jgi:hypothetical protein
MKKALSLVALGTLVATVAACAKPEEKKPETKTEAPKVVEETTASIAATAPSTAAPA